MKKLLVLAACLVAFAAAPALAQTGGPAVIVVQVSYGATSFGGGTAYMTISRGAGKTETVESKGYLKTKEEEPERFQQVIAQLYQEGYTLKSTFVQYLRPVTMVFVKGQ